MYNSLSNPKSSSNIQNINSIPRDHAFFEPPKHLKDQNYIPLSNGIASLGLPAMGLINNTPNTMVFQATKKLEHMNCIIQADQAMGGLYIGDIISTVKPGLIQSGKIQALLTCNFEENHFHNTARRDIKITTKIIDCKDNLDYPIQMHFPASFQFIQSNRIQKKNVLVNCHAGKSRSGTIVCAYLIRKYKWTAERALNTIRNKRDRVKPNNGFWEKLLKYEKQILGDLNQIFPTSTQKAQRLPFKHSEGPQSARKDQFKMKMSRNFQQNIQGTSMFPRKSEENTLQKQKIQLRKPTKSIKTIEKYAQSTKSTPNLNLNAARDLSSRKNQGYVQNSSPYRQPINYPTYNPSLYAPPNYTNTYYQTPSQSYYPNTYPSQTSYGAFDQTQKNTNIYYTPIQNKTNFNELNLSENRNYSTGQALQQENPETRKKLFEKNGLKLGQRIKNDILNGKQPKRQAYKGQ